MNIIMVNEETKELKFNNGKIEWHSGFKAGILLGIFLTIITTLLVKLSYDIMTGLIIANTISIGILVGLAFAYIYRYLPTQKTLLKAFVYSLIFAILYSLLLVSYIYFGVVQPNVSIQSFFIISCFAVVIGGGIILGYFYEFFKNQKPKNVMNDLLGYLILVCFISIWINAFFFFAYISFLMPPALPSLSYILNYIIYNADLYITIGIVPFVIYGVYKLKKWGLFLAVLVSIYKIADTLLDIFVFHRSISIIWSLHNIIFFAIVIFYLYIRRKIFK